MSILWPVSALPRPLADGYGMVAMPSTIRTDMDNGFARQRRRFTRAPTTVSLNFNMRADEFGIFDSWWRSVLLDGTEWFLMPLRNGVSDNYWTVRSLKPPEASLATIDVYRIAWQLEVDAVPALSAGDVLSLIASQSTSLIPQSDALHAFVHVEYPIISLYPYGP